jgi:hypothetical protein
LCCILEQIIFSDMSAQETETPMSIVVADTWEKLGPPPKLSGWNKIMSQVWQTGKDVKVAGRVRNPVLQERHRRRR